MQRHQLSRKWKDHAQVTASDRVDTLRIPQLRALHAELPAGFCQLFFFLLRFLDAVSVLYPLIMLPGVNEETQQNHGGEPRHHNVVAIALHIGFADDVAVDDSLFQMDFYGHQLLSHTRSFALRARGLRRTSSSPAVTTFFVRT